MPRQPDAQISPYLTHMNTHHGQITLVPADNNGRRRKARQNAAASNSLRSLPRDAPTRFSAAPSSTGSRTPTSGGLLSRIRRISRPVESLDDIPDYPPPSFQEAMASPSISVFQSTTTLGRLAAPQTSHIEQDSDSGSDDDTLSLDVVDRASVPERPPIQTSQPPRGRGILDSDPDDTGYGPSAVNPRAHRRHLSLSPLRTLFPSRNNRESAYMLSAQSTPSPHSLAFTRASPHSRSTTSLRNVATTPPSPPASPSIRSENPLGSRRFFPHKDKGKEREALDSWQIVESELPEALEISPPERAPSPLQEAPLTATSISASQRAFPREKAVPILSSPFRERERRHPQTAPVPLPTVPRDEGPPPIVTVRSRIPPPPSCAPPPTPISPGPPVVTVRTKKAPPPPPPKRKPQPVSSPLRDSPLPDLDLDRAVQTPLPSTPVTGSPTSSFAFPSELASPSKESMNNIFDILPSPTDQPPSSAIDKEGHHHHYPGRPLPQRPRVIVDSTYAPHPEFPPVEIPLKPPNVPEGLLIDLEDEIETPIASTQSHNLVDIDDTPTVTPTVHLRPTPVAVADANRQSTASSVELAPATSDFLDITDLDILLAQIENDQRDGLNYDALLMMSDFIGPASSVQAEDSSKNSALLSGHIEVSRRRVLKDGRVKLKLVLLGTTVDRCGICMCQFKKAQPARLSECCRHVYHAQCLGRWISKSRTCPLCRIALGIPKEEVGAPFDTI
ncbi:hypothetical protein C8F01DRAFT_1127961 [Mycena amicta]|nr:hypothetical protein C8F01DRAFT_1127961 [Mycena amicta]